MVKRASGALLLSINIDPSSPRPIATQLYTSLRDLTLSGAVAAGTRLPASRTLADDLGISRTTVIDAFDRLIAEGLLESRIGSGTFVSRVLNAERAQFSQREVRSQPVRRPSLSKAAARAIDHVSDQQRLSRVPRAFIAALPAFDCFPMAQWYRLAAKHWRDSRDEVMGYGVPSGHLGLREAIAAHLRTNRGIACEMEQIFVVGGAQQAFQLIGRVLLDPGDKVWFENPGPIGARNSLIICGADLVPVPVDEEGLHVEEGLRRAKDFRLAFVTPSHQQPLGHVMSLERRFALLQAAEQAGAWIIEDDCGGEFFFGRRPPPTLRSIDDTDRVIYVGTFSKSLFPSLRLGFMVAPSSLVPTFQKLSTAVVQGVPTSVQATVAEFMQEGHFASHIRRMCRVYEERHGALLDAAKNGLMGLLDVVASQSGLHTVGYLPSQASDMAIARAAAERGIVVSPISRFSIGPTELRGLVLGFGSIAPNAIRCGVAVLRDVLVEQVKPQRTGTV